LEQGKKRIFSQDEKGREEENGLFYRVKRMGLQPCMLPAGHRAKDLVKKNIPRGEKDRRGNEERPSLKKYTL